MLVGLARSLAVTALLVGMFFAAYFVAYEPYRALYPDLIPREAAGRAQTRSSAVARSRNGTRPDPGRTEAA